MQATVFNHSSEQSKSRLSIQVRPLGAFGAEIVDFKLDCDRSPEMVGILRSALLQYKMLIFRNKNLSPDEQIAFSLMFGDELHRAGAKLRHLPQHPEIFKISNQSGNGNLNTGQYWHSDGHYVRDPSAITVMHMVSATSDGATRVADSTAAFARLTDANKDYLSKLAFLTPETGTAHPIVIRHPRTGQPCLYVNLAGQAVDSNLQQVPQVSRFIDTHLNAPDSFYEHHWQHGDTMVLDNFATAHRGTPSDPANVRVMHRTTVTGPSVWWRTLNRSRT